MSAAVPSWSASDLAFMLSFACQLAFWCFMPAALVSIIAGTISQHMPEIRALLRASKEK